ncbi:phosphatase PAP2 family protein [Thalassomonas haliotis]|nr:phosphatase PAP2 family protein [Thalassomonas haliotis]
MLSDLYQYDLRMLLWCRKSRFYPQFITFVRGVSRSGDGYLQLSLPLVYGLIYPEDSWQFMSLILIAFSIERPLYLILKNTLKRRRPPQVVAHFTSVIAPADQFSFPSGHTMAAFLLAGIALGYLGMVALPLYLWAFAVGCSRVILGVHFPSDILAGACLGTGLALGVSQLI